MFPHLCCSTKDFDVVFPSSLVDYKDKDVTRTVLVVLNDQPKADTSVGFSSEKLFIFFTIKQSTRSEVLKCVCYTQNGSMPLFWKPETWFLQLARRQILGKFGKNAKAQQWSTKCSSSSR